MLKSQKLQLDMSEKRQAINAMSAQEEYEIDALDGLNSEYRNLEIRFQSALIEEAAEAEATPTSDLDSEGREVRHLEEGVEVRHYLEAALNDYPLDGKEAELQSALGLAGVGTQVPWIALLSPEQRVEVRAATTAPLTPMLWLRPFFRACSPLARAHILALLFLAYQSAQAQTIPFSVSRRNHLLTLRAARRLTRRRQRSYGKC